MQYADVYVDDFISLVQGTKNDRRQAMRTLLHMLDSVFRPWDSNRDTPFRQEPASVKKLKKGDASWSTKKVVLGWLLDSVDKTISLPPHRIERLQTILASIGPTKKRISAKNWHRLLGELRSMVIGIPGARGLFSPLQEAFRTKTPDHRLLLNAMVHQFLDDFRQLSKTLFDRPTRIAELIPQDPSVIGTTDASGQGMGGVAFLNTPSGLRPILWRHRYPKHVQSRLITFDNPRGLLSIGDLELSAMVCQHDVITTAADAWEHTIHSFHDNTAAQFWQGIHHYDRTGCRPASPPVTPSTGVPLYELLGAAPRSAADSFCRDLDISQQTVQKGIVRGTQDCADAHWELWTKFCEELGLDPLLRVPDPVQFLQVFATCYCRRPGKYPGECVQSGTISNAICLVGQTMASMGARDARKDSTGSIDFRLTRMFRRTTNDDTPFRFLDVQLKVGVRHLDLLTTTPAELWAATSVALTFTTQKNGVRGEVICHGRSGHDVLCPVRSMIRRILHLRQHTANMHTIIATYFQNGRHYSVKSADITTTLRQVTAACGADIGFLPSDVSARSALRAMALFCSNVDRDTMNTLFILARILSQCTDSINSRRHPDTTNMGKRQR
ncbi:unnamed protein product [Cylindrotheca closterium]|uniref:Reverse transcriptase domain-containing protein n=1 Tax=Cylindrotheca closterium TaxID=2856 RepID=A0AAD2JGH8_9STRA|nr:unnamed protein product [Cylindrotheca closterium]